jgi:hypothetical protein
MDVDEERRLPMRFAGLFILMLWAYCASAEEPRFEHEDGGMMGQYSTA